MDISTGERRNMRIDWKAAQELSGISDAKRSQADAIVKKLLDGKRLASLPKALDFLGACLGEWAAHENDLDVKSALGDDPDENALDCEIEAFSENAYSTSEVALTDAFESAHRVLGLRPPKDRQKAMEPMLESFHAQFEEGVRRLVEGE